MGKVIIVITGDGSVLG